LLWEVLRLGAHALWGSIANPVRPLLERQQALSVLGLPPNATRQQIKRRYRALAKSIILTVVETSDRCSVLLLHMNC